MNATRKDAIAKARAAGLPRVLVELDYQDTRRRYVVDPDYVNGPEFEAFEGAVVESFYPDGTSDREIRG